MLNMKERQVREEQMRWINGEISKVYWAFADDLSDGSGELLNDYLEGEFKKKLEQILWDDYKAYGDVDPK